MPLTKRQREVLTFLDGYIREHGYAPSFEEIAEHFRFQSLATVHEHLTNLREQHLLKQMVVWLQRSRYKREREIVESLVEQGYDPLEIAAAAVKIARADEKQRPIAEVAQVSEERRERDFSRGGKRESFGRSEKPGRFGDKMRVKGSRTHEDGMVRCRIKKGKAHNIRPNDIVGQIAFHANIPGHTIGKIRVEDKITFVDIPEDVVDQVLKHSGNYMISRERFSLVRA